MADQACKAWSGMDIALRTAISELGFFDISQINTNKRLERTCFVRFLRRFEKTKYYEIILGHLRLWRVL